jgi:hypothetical protein
MSAETELLCALDESNCHSSNYPIAVYKKNNDVSEDINLDSCDRASSLDEKSSGSHLFGAS